VAIAPDESGKVEKVTTTKSTPAPKATTTSNFTYGSGNPFFVSLQQSLAEQNIAKGRNADGSVKTTTQRFQEERAAAAGMTLTQAAANPMFNKSVKPVAPAGFYYAWIGGTNTGQWTLYKSAGSTTTTTSSSGSGKGKNDGSTDTTDTTGVPSTSLDVLKALLKSQGFSAGIIDSSASYLNSLLKDNIDYDNAIEIFLNTKDYTLKNGTKITSPFYASYGYLNEGLTVPKSAGELFNAVEGYKGLKEKYGFSDKYLSPESLKNYVKNNVTVEDLDKRANDARLAALTQDPAKTQAFIKLGYIADATGLQDFYMDSKIGKEQLELNKNTGAFVAEAIRRASSPDLVENMQVANYRKIASELTAKGYSETQISNLAATGFENIKNVLEPTVALSGIYEKTPGTTATKQAIQTELEQEEFMNMASLRRKKLAEQNAKAFEARSGVTQYSLGSSTLL
jgi:hypothetical protein